MSDARHRPHRLDRHGQEHDRGDVRARAACRCTIADAAVHRLYSGEAVAPIEAAFPGVTADGAVDRARLPSGSSAIRRRWRGSRRSCIRWCGESEAAFLAKARAGGRRLVVVDVPLLFETGAAERFDVIVVVTRRSENPARPRARPARNDGGEIRGDCSPGKCPTARSAGARISSSIRDVASQAAEREVDAMLRALAAVP